MQLNANIYSYKYKIDTQLIRHQKYYQLSVEQSRHGMDGQSGPIQICCTVVGAEYT